MDLDKCMKCLHNYKIIQSSFTALEILYALPIYFFLPLTPGNYWYFFYCLYGFVFYKMS